MVVVGGSGSIAGVLVGVVLIGLLPELLRVAPRGLLVWQEFVYGLILVLATMFMPRGLWGVGQSLVGRARPAKPVPARGRSAPASGSPRHERDPVHQEPDGPLRRPVRAERLLDGRRGGRRSMP